MPTWEASAVPGNGGKRRCRASGAAGKAGLTLLGQSPGTLVFFLPLVLSFHLLICLQIPMGLQKQCRITVGAGAGLPCPLGS